MPPEGGRWGPGGNLPPGPFLSPPADWALAHLGGRNFSPLRRFGVGVAREDEPLRERHMNGLIYLIGLIVVILAILSFFGLR